MRGETVLLGATGVLAVSSSSTRENVHQHDQGDDDRRDDGDDGDGGHGQGHASVLPTWPIRENLDCERDCSSLGARAHDLPRSAPAPTEVWCAVRASSVNPADNSIAAGVPAGRRSARPHVSRAKQGFERLPGEAGHRISERASRRPKPKRGANM